VLEWPSARSTSISGRVSNELFERQITTSAALMPSRSAIRLKGSLSDVPGLRVGREF